MTNTVNSTGKELKIPSKGPHSRAFARGASSAWDGRSYEGRFLKKCEAELTAQLGGDLTWSQTMLVRRAARSLLQLELFDARIAAGDFNECNSRMMGGIANNLRLTLRELGIKATAKPKVGLAEYLASKK